MESRGFTLPTRFSEQKTNFKHALSDDYSRKKFPISINFQAEELPLLMRFPLLHKM